jgi:hypothetical protein
MRLRTAVPFVAVAALTTAHAEPVSLACEKVSPLLDAVLAREPPGTVTMLREPLLACFETHRICGVVYDHTQVYARVFYGEQSSDVPEVEYHNGGASYALMASRSLPPSRKSGFEYCLALTPGEQKSEGPFDWHGWQISPAGEVRALDLSSESSVAVHTNPRSMAVALWNLYEARF